MGNEIELYSKLQSGSVSDTLSAIETMGKWFVKSGFISSGSGTIQFEAGNMLALACFTEKKDPLTVLRTFDVIPGRGLRKKSLAIAAEFRGRGGKYQWLKDGEDGVAAKVKLTFEGQELVFEYTMDKARKAGLIRPAGEVRKDGSIRKEGPWETNPGDMLRKSALSKGITMLCPEIVAGCIDTAEEETEKVVIPLFPPQVVTEPATEVKAEPVKEKVVTPISEPAQPAETQPEPSSEPEIEVNPDKRLTEKTVMRIATALGEHGNLVMEWLATMGIKDLRNLSTVRAKQMLTETDKIVKKATDWKSKQQS